MVAGLLAHIDALEQAIASLDARIAAATDRGPIELLTTIPGLQHARPRYWSPNAGST